MASLRPAPLSRLDLGSPSACRSICLLLAAILVVYANSFHCEWHYDDLYNIVENPGIQIKTMSASALWKAMVAGSQHPGAVSRPLAYLSFALNYLYGGLEVTGYHVVNVGIHFLAAVILYLLIRRLLRLPRLVGVYGPHADHIALLGTVLWALHPLNVTAVTYIVQRMASLATLFYLIAMYSYVRARVTQGGWQRSGWLIGCAAAALAAVATKENAVMVPIALVAIDYYLIQRPDHKLPIWFTLFAGVAISLIVIGGIYKLTAGGAMTGYQYRPFTPLQRLLTQPRILLFYLGLWIYPTGSRMMLLHDPRISTGLLSPATTLPAIVAVATAVIFSLLGRRRFPLVSFAVFFFWMNHIVESSIVPLELIYEHRNYLPMVFLHTLLAVLILHCLAYFNTSRLVRPLLFWGVAFFIGANGFATYLYNDIFRTDLGLWLNNARKTPELSVVQNNLGNEYLAYGKNQQGIAAIEKALKSGHFNNNTQEAVVYSNLGRAYERIEGADSEKAAEAYEKAVRLNPATTKAWVRLALSATRKGQFNTAENTLKKARRYSRHPDDPNLLNSLSLVQLKLGRQQSAYRNAVKVIAKVPTAVAPRAVLAEIHRQRGELTKALACWREILSIQPGHQEALLALTELYTRLGNREARAAMVDRLMGLQPGRSLSELIKREAALENMSAWTFDRAVLRKAFEEYLQANLKALH